VWLPLSLLFSGFLPCRFAATFDWSFACFLMLALSQVLVMRHINCTEVNTEMWQALFPRSPISTFGGHAAFGGCGWLFDLRRYQGVIRRL
jgi:hypothetical protein